MRRKTGFDNIPVLSTIQSSKRFTSLSWEGNSNMSELDKLSERDRAVLKSIFDPTAIIGDVTDNEDHFEDDEPGFFLFSII